MNDTELNATVQKGLDLLDMGKAKQAIVLFLSLIHI